MEFGLASAVVATLPKWPEMILMLVEFSLDSDWD